MEKSTRSLKTELCFLLLWKPFQNNTSPTKWLTPLCYPAFLNKTFSHASTVDKETKIEICLYVFKLWQLVHYHQSLIDRVVYSLLSQSKQFCGYISPLETYYITLCTNWRSGLKEKGTKVQMTDTTCIMGYEGCSIFGPRLDAQQDLKSVHLDLCCLHFQKFITHATQIFSSGMMCDVCCSILSYILSCAQSWLVKC